MATTDLVTQKQAAAILNRSVSAVSRAIKDGRLEYIDSERRLLHRPGLEVRFRQTTRPRIDKPQRKTQNPQVRGSSPVGSQPIATDYWQRLSDKLSFVLDGAPAYWSKAPDAHHLRLFVRTIDELRSQVEAEGLEQSPHRGV